MSPYCENCGSFVSRSYVRVFGTVDGTLRICSDCRSWRELFSAEGAK